MIASKLIEWTGENAIERKFTAERYAVLSDASVNQLISEALSEKSGSVLTSPKVITSQGQSAWVGIFSEGESQESGTVFFVEPTSITRDGAELQYSFQMLNRPEEGQPSESRLARTVRLEGAARLNIGHWLVQELEKDALSDSRKALLIQIERVEIPHEHATMLGG
ncbi:MAG: hypothetical protein DHS20C16_30670 [Phycisphaerae bacterium]|nr:MAG: hypothetical protein DHS20C16_30670 [Phycisphaerae bacterium]